MVNGGTESCERLEMLRHAVALVVLETVARIVQAEADHQAVARNLRDNGGGGDGRNDGVPADHRLAFAGHSEAVASSDEDESRTHRQARDSARQRPEGCTQDVVAIDARGR